MKDFDIIDDYKQPSDEEIEKSQNFSELMARYNMSHKNGKSNNRIKFIGGTILLVSIVSILSYYVINKYDNHRNEELEVKPKALILQVIKDSVFDKRTLVQEKDTLIKPIQDHAVSLKERSSKMKHSSIDITKQLNPKDSVHNTSKELLQDKPVKTDSIIDPAKNKVKVKNGNQTIYEQDQQELEKKFLERYYQKKK
ncbi:MAG: hypothetical protein J7604_19430 [Sporocytophaga sp.]|uniref:hypothetical protein n=1 Tax=Sporocytophaga sp. TaxID=2231183 RepID=UPI001B0EB2D8|nr:hypothetical protein [Sporocytophaga sp.]MBO9702391.1 hypothetical protein [Sporocytophaga sp.]